MKWMSGIRTRDNVARIHGVFVLDEAEAIHELDLGNLAGAMCVEVVLNIGLGSYSHKVQLAMPGVQASPCQASQAPAPDAPENARCMQRDRSRERAVTVSASPKSDARAPDTFTIACAGASASCAILPAAAGS